MKKWQIYLIIFSIIFSTILALTAVFFLGRSTVTIKTDVISSGDIKPSFNLEFKSGKSYDLKKLKKEADEFWSKKIPDIIKDTSLNEGGELKIIPKYIAEVDTSFNDSSLSLKVKYISPIPLHPDSYFNFIFEQKRKLALTESGFFSNKLFLLAGVEFNIRDYKLNARLLIGGGYKFIKTKHFELIGEYTAGLKSLTFSDADHSIRIINKIIF